MMALPQTTLLWYDECHSWPLPTMVFSKSPLCLTTNGVDLCCTLLPFQAICRNPIFPILWFWLCFTENPFSHFLFPRSKNAVSQNASIPHIRTSYDTAPKITPNHQVIPFTQSLDFFYPLFKAIFFFFF